MCKRNDNNNNNNNNKPNQTDNTRLRVRDLMEIMFVLQCLLCSMKKIVVRKKPVGCPSASSVYRSGTPGWGKANAARKLAAQQASIEKTLENARHAIPEELKHQVLYAVGVTTTPPTVYSAAASVATGAAPVTPVRRTAPEEFSPAPTKAACAHPVS